MKKITLYTYALEIPEPLLDQYEEACEWQDTHSLEFIIRKDELKRIVKDLFAEYESLDFEEWYTYDVSYRVYEKAKKEGKVISERIVEG